MYDISLSINGVTLAMNHGAGYDIFTISGLTGTTGKLNTAMSNLSLGEDYTYGTVSGITLNVRGVILDGNTEKKQALLNTVLPLGEGTLSIYTTPSSGDRPSLYRTIDVVVKETPTISQEKHSKFSFSLYAPKPIWKAPAAEAIVLTNTVSGGNTVEVTIAGQTKADFSLQIGVQANGLKDYSIYFGDAQTYILGKYIYLNFRKYDEDGVASGSTVKLFRDKGKITLTIDNVKHNECIYALSTLDALDIGTHTFHMDADANNLTRVIYYPSYIGVLVDGV